MVSVHSKTGAGGAGEEQEGVKTELTCISTFAKSMANIEHCSN